MDLIVFLDMDHCIKFTLTFTLLWLTYTMIVSYLGEPCKYHCG